jgi:hypothetical protein
LVCALVACLGMLGSASAHASTTVIEAESMQWRDGVGQVYSDAAASSGAGFQDWSNAFGTASVNLPLAPTGLKIRVRSAQRRLSAFDCQGKPQVTVKIGGTTIVTASITPNAGYLEPVVDVHRIPAGLQQVQVGLSNNNPNSSSFPCSRQVWIDKLTIVGSRIFSPLAWRSQALAADAALDPDQSAVHRLMTQLSVHGAWVNTRQWSAPIYVVPGNQKRVGVHVEAHEPAELWGDWQGAPIPADAMSSGPADGYDERDGLLQRLNKGKWTDRSLVLYQPATDTLWEFFHLVRRGGVFYAADGGRISNLSDSLGTWDAWPFPDDPHGATGAGLPHMAGIQTIDEVVRRGSIDHVVSLTLPHVTDVDPSHANPDWSPVRAPAIRSDGDRNPLLVPDAIEEGTRFRLPASLDLDSLGLTPYGLILARAIQRYGAIVVNRNCAVSQACTGDDADSNAAVTFYAEIPRTTVDPWTSKFGQGFPNGALRNFPWAQLQVLPPLAG